MFLTFLSVLCYSFSSLCRLRYGFLLDKCPLSSLSVSISPFSVRWPRCCLVLWLIIKQLPFNRRAHQPFSRPMATLLSSTTG